jgi:DNA topoisomerase-2
VLKNNVINNLRRILGLVHNVDEKKIHESLRYGHILLMMDQDDDGSHIKGLVINLIYNMWPSLIRTKDFLSEFITPIVKATHSNPDMVKSFYTLQAFRDWRQDNNNDFSDWTIKYYKGLGSSTDYEAVGYFEKMDQNQKIFTWEDDTDSNAIEDVFDEAPAKVQTRRDWIKSFESSQVLPSPTF